MSRPRPGAKPPQIVRAFALIPVRLYADESLPPLMRVLLYLHARGFTDRWIRIGPMEIARELRLKYQTVSAILTRLLELRAMCAQGSPRRREYRARLDSE